MKTPKETAKEFVNRRGREMTISMVSFYIEQEEKDIEDAEQFPLTHAQKIWFWKEVLKEAKNGTQGGQGWD